MERLPTPVFWPREFHGLYSPCSGKESAFTFTDFPRHFPYILDSRPPGLVITYFLLPYSDFPGGSDDKASVYNVGDLGSIPGLGRSPAEGKWQPIPVFWPREFHGLYSPWGCKESDMTEQLSLSEAVNGFGKLFPVMILSFFSLYRVSFL